MNGGARRGSKKVSKGKKVQRGGNMTCVLPNKVLIDKATGNVSCVDANGLIVSTVPPDHVVEVKDLQATLRKTGGPIQYIPKEAKVCTGSVAERRACMSSQEGGKRSGSKKSSKKGSKGKKGSKRH